MSRARIWHLSYNLVLLSLICVHSEQLDRCKLAHLLRHKYGFEEQHIDDWVCLARWESHYNTSAVGTLNADGSRDLGLFQVSEKYWCRWNKRGKGCHLRCEDLIDDDIDDDVKCVQRIFREHKRLSGNGFNAWVAWKTRCQGDLTAFTADCHDVDREIESDFTPGIVAPLT